MTDSYTVPKASSLHVTTNINGCKHLQLFSRNMKKVLASWNARRYIIYRSGDTIARQTSQEDQMIKQAAQNYLQENGPASFIGSICEMIVGPVKQNSVDWKRIRTNMKHKERYSSVG
jgi:hypothetical protein